MQRHFWEVMCRQIGVKRVPKYLWLCSPRSDLGALEMDNGVCEPFLFSKKKSKDGMQIFSAQKNCCHLWENAFGQKMLFPKQMRNLSCAQWSCRSGTATLPPKEETFADKQVLGPGLAPPPCSRVAGPKSRHDPPGRGLSGVQWGFCIRLAQVGGKGGGSRGAITNTNQLHWGISPQIVSTFRSPPMVCHLTTPMAKWRTTEEVSPHNTFAKLWKESELWWPKCLQRKKMFSTPQNPSIFQKSKFCHHFSLLFLVPIILHPVMLSVMCRNTIQGGGDKHKRKVDLVWWVDEWMAQALFEPQKR